MKRRLRFQDAQIDIFALVLMCYQNVVSAPFYRASDGVIANYLPISNARFSLADDLHGSHADFSWNDCPSLTNPVQALGNINSTQLTMQFENKITQKEKVL